DVAAAVADGAALRAGGAARSGLAWGLPALERRVEAADLARRTITAVDEPAAAVTGIPALGTRVAARLWRALIAPALVGAPGAAELPRWAHAALQESAAAVADRAALRSLSFAGGRLALRRAGGGAACDGSTA